MEFKSFFKVFTVTLSIVVISCLAKADAESPDSQFEDIAELGSLISAGTGLGLEGARAHQIRAFSRLISTPTPLTDPQLRILYRHSSQVNGLANARQFDELRLAQIRQTGLAPSFSIRRSGVSKLSLVLLVVGTGVAAFTLSDEAMDLLSDSQEEVVEFSDVEIAE